MLLSYITQIETYATFIFKYTDFFTALFLDMLCTVILICRKSNHFSKNWYSKRVTYRKLCTQKYIDLVLKSSEYLPSVDEHFGKYILYSY